MTRRPTLPIPDHVRERFYSAAWDLAWSGHLCVGGERQLFERFGSGSIIARRHGLQILWLTAMAGRFNELANLTAGDVDTAANVVCVARSKGGAKHEIAVDPALVWCTRSWHGRVAREAAATTPRSYRQRSWAQAIAGSKYLLPSSRGEKINVNVFNRDVAGPLGQLFGLRLSSHCFRDTACQRAMAAVNEDAKLDVRAVQALMGHRSLRTTEHYLRKVGAKQIRLSLT